LIWLFIILCLYSPFIRLSMSLTRSLEDVHGTIDTTGNMSWWRRFILFIGPAFMVCVGYMDPGNWATDIAGGSRYGYQLLWVLLLSNLIALLLQSLSARLGIVRGRDLAQISRETYPPLINFALYVLAEIAIAACDLAEVLGMAIGIHLLFDIPIIYGVGIGVFDTFIILYLQRKGIRYMEVYIFSLVSVIGLCFVVEVFFAKPAGSEVLHGFVPTSLSGGALYIAMGIIGATVMPHNLYLHSSLVQTRRNGSDQKSIARAIKYNFWDAAIALNLAFFVNTFILIVAAAVFYTKGYHEVIEIQDAHGLLAPLMGKKIAPAIFAIALIASGQSSTITGTLAGQIVMEGYLDLRIAAWLRRLITRSVAVIPALIVIYYLGDGKVGDMLILSQVVLSVQLGFAVIPLIHFVSDKKQMGVFAIRTVWRFVAWFTAALIVALNVKMILETLSEWHEKLVQYPFVYYSLIIPVLGLSFLLLLVAAIYPLLKRSQRRPSLTHGQSQDLPLLEKQVYPRIAICVDFSTSDVKALTHGISQGGKDSVYYLIHIVESATARAVGEETRDYETLEDWRNLHTYGDKLRAQGYHVEEKLSFGNPRTAIPKIVNELDTSLLVIGSHGHEGLQDIVYGETIQTVRHKVKCPVLIV
jgi:manganese transport protein